MQEFSNFRRGIISFYSFVLFGVVGFIVAIGLGVYGWWPDEDPLVESLPLVLGFGGLAAFLGYRYPRVFNVFLWFMP